MMNQFSYPYMPNPFMMQQPDSNALEQLEERVNRLERQVKRLEKNFFSIKENQNYDYSSSPPKDNGMYMM